MAEPRKPEAAKPTAAAKPAAPAPGAGLAEVRERIDGIDRADPGPDRRARADGRSRSARPRARSKAAVDYYRPEREAQVLRQVLDRNDGPLNDEVLVRLFREIMSACLAQQEPLKVGFLGPEGTFSQQAVLKHFGHSARGLPLSSIEEVFQEVEAGHADFGVVPVENSGQGTIQSTLDMFLTSTLKICGEVELRVHQHLLSRSGRIEDIERVYSHPQSFAQCKAWLRAAPAERREDRRWPATPRPRAARATPTTPRRSPAPAAGNVYGLKVVAGPIEDRPDNTTRFLVLGRELFPTSGHDRTSLLVFIKRPARRAVQRAVPFARHGVSMNRIESRPGAHRALAVRVLHRHRRPRGRGRR